MKTKPVKKKKAREIQVEGPATEGPIVQKIGFVRRTATAKCEVSSHELVAMIRDSLCDRGVSEVFADDLARGVLRNLRYGVPTPTEDRPVSIRDTDPVDVPLCKEHAA